MLLVAIALSIALALILPHFHEKRIPIPSTSAKETGMPAWTATLEDIGKWGMGIHLTVNILTAEIFHFLKLIIN